MLRDKYKNVLDLGVELNIQDGYVEEEGGKLKIGGSAEYQYDADRLWDAIKEHDGWEGEVEAQISVRNEEIYGIYTVQPGDTLSKLSKATLGDAMKYMDIFNANRDQLDNPDMIKVGQKLKLPK